MILGGSTLRAALSVSVQEYWRWLTGLLISIQYVAVISV